MEGPRTTSVSTSPVDALHRPPVSSRPKPTDGSMSVLSEAPDDPCYQQYTAWRMYRMWHVPWVRSKKLRWRARAGATGGLARVGDLRVGGTAYRKPSRQSSPVGAVFQT